MAFSIDNDLLSRYMVQSGVQPSQNTCRVLGIRGASPIAPNQLSLNDDRLDDWNDTVGIWGNDWGLWPATVEPGLYYTQFPLDPDGAAHLLPLEEAKHPWLFKWGLHHGEYEALVQAEDFKVRRDRNRDGVPEPDEPVEIGDFGIHIHWGGSMAAVGKWSAGCQVLKGGGDPGSPWTVFKAKLKASGQARFEYYLIDGADLARFGGFL